MNHIRDLNGNSVFFGDDFVIRESISEGMKELTLYVAGEKILLARDKKDRSFAFTLPGMIIFDFSKKYEGNK